ncbi:MAG: 5'-nucleotidase C-terminal domain-containing protein [Lachnospiraceae bacterium]|nr:5'-nucleotidase C-terminal domain-containing protein [Lachnospiraceae bacterium]
MRRFGKRKLGRLAVFAAGMLGLVLFCPNTDSGAQAAVVPAIGEEDLEGKIVILHTNDTHARVQEDTENGQMGYAAVGALKKACEEAGAEVILLDAGDTLHGLPFATVSQGESIVRVMNAVGYDAMTPGNHDFNYGVDRLVELAQLTEFPILCADVVDKENEEHILDCHMIIEKNGIKFGIFGLATPDTEYKTNPKNIESVWFTDVYEAAYKEVAALKQEGADIIIALAHIGLDESSVVTSKELAGEVPGIDLIVDGHSHSVLENGLWTDDTLIVSTGEYIEQIGAVIVDEDGTMTAALVNPEEFSERDEAIEEVMNEVQAELDEQLKEPVGTIAVDLNGEREYARTGEINLGNLAADAMRYATGADIAITNGGGIRASIPAGTITKKDVVTVFPFGNYVVTKRIKGSDLIAALEHGVRAYPEQIGAYPQISGITFTLNTAAEPGSRISNVCINGNPINPEYDFLVATNDFLAAGGDGYTMFTEAKTVNEFGSMEEILAEYLQTEPDPESFAVGRVTVVEKPEEESDEKTADEKAADEEAAGESKEEPETESQERILYLVRKGDCLYKIAREQLGSGARWEEIYEWNKENIANPELIYPNQELILYAG